jgi:hypothetical protein
MSGESRRVERTARVHAVASRFLRKIIRAPSVSMARRLQSLTPTEQPYPLETVRYSREADALLTFSPPRSTAAAVGPESPPLLCLPDDLSQKRSPAHASGYRSSDAWGQLNEPAQPPWGSPPRPIVAPEIHRFHDFPQA